MIKKKILKAKSIKINKSGFRKDLDDYFKIYMFQYKKQISPFIIIENDTIRIGTHTVDLLNLPYEVTIFHTWVGKYRSDVFVYTIKEMVDWVYKQPDHDFYLAKLTNKRISTERLFP